MTGWSDLPSSWTETGYTVEVVAARTGVRVARVRYYERLGLVEARRAQGDRRWYGDEAIERVQQIERMMRDLGVNLAGVEVIFHMREQILALQRELEATRGAPRD